jgi:hypothetical protein
MSGLGFVKGPHAEGAVCCGWRIATAHHTNRGFSVTDNDVPSTGDEQERRRLVERLVKIDLGGGFG